MILVIPHELVAGVQALYFRSQSVNMTSDQSSCLKGSTNDHHTSDLLFWPRECLQAKRREYSREHSLTEVIPLVRKLQY